MASVLSVERFLHSKRANFVISESRSQIYLGYAEYKQNLDKNRIIKEEKYLRNLCYLWENWNKQEQSQACLDYAERRQFLERSEKIIFRVIRAFFAKAQDRWFRVL